MFLGDSHIALVVRETGRRVRSYLDTILILGLELESMLILAPLFPDPWVCFFVRTYWGGWRDVCSWWEVTEVAKA